MVRVLDVRPEGPEAKFVGARKPGGVGRVFGGQIVGQGIMAASKTVGADRSLHSLHSYFIRPASEDHEIDYSVEADLDGSSFSNRRVLARQQGKPVFNLTASFHRREDGPGHSVTIPDVPPPEELPNFADFVETYPHLASPVLKRIVTRPSALEYRPFLELTPEQVALAYKGHSHCWIRMGSRPLDVSQAMQCALLAWESDTLLLATAYRAHGFQIGTGEFHSASIDHSMWIHDEVQVGDWLLFTTTSSWTGKARGLALGRFFTREGRLVASVTQEGLMRPV
jgi:acyl-CoA thioesterase-2